MNTICDGWEDANRWSLWRHTCGDILATETYERHVEGVHAMLNEDRSMKCTLTAAEVGISTESVIHILTR
jgi:hypothetical protein